MTTIQMTSCYYDNQADLHPGSVSLPCDTSDFSYTGKVTDILRTNCYGCHTSSAASGNVILDTYNGVKTVVNNGRLMGSINQLSGFSPMPKNLPKLSDCDQKIIKKWIETGSTPN